MTLRKLTGIPFLIVALGASTAILSGCNVEPGSVPPRAGTRVTATPIGSPATGSPAAATTNPSPATTALAGFRSTREVAQVAPPVAVSIPRIGVSATIERLGRNTDGTVAVPRKPADAGWYDQGPRPGENGAAVVLGHVDSKTGPAVFYELRSLHRGDHVIVRRSDGTSVNFVVDRTEKHAKSRFPAVEVYWPTLRPELRLITCGGAYVKSAGGYQDNVIVFARMA